MLVSKETYEDVDALRNLPELRSANPVNVACNLLQREQPDEALTYLLGMEDTLFACGLTLAGNAVHYVRDLIKKEIRFIP
jgi:hypothetical protein